MFLGRMGFDAQLTHMATTDQLIFKNEVVELSGQGTFLKINGIDFAVGFSGEIDNVEVLEKQLDSPQSGAHSIEELLLLGYFVKGVDLFGELLGSFSLVIYDGADDQLILARDRQGSRPLVYTLDSKLTCASALGQGLDDEVTEVKAGHFAVYSKNGFVEEPYDAPRGYLRPVLESAPLFSLSAEKRLRVFLLEKALKERLSLWAYTKKAYSQLLEMAPRCAGESETAAKLRLMYRANLRWFMEGM